MSDDREGEVKAADADEALTGPALKEAVRVLVLKMCVGELEACCEAFQRFGRAGHPTVHPGMVAAEMIVQKRLEYLRKQLTPAPAHAEETSNVIQLRP